MITPTTEIELKQAHAAHAENIRLLMRTEFKAPADRQRAEKTINNLRNQMIFIDTQLMRIEGVAA